MEERHDKSGGVACDDPTRGGGVRDPESVVVRRAVGADHLSKLSELYLKLYASEASFDPDMNYWDCDLRTRCVMMAADCLSNFSITTLVAECGGEVVGFVTLVPVTSYGVKANVLTIKSMFVEEDHRGVVARKLWNEVRRVAGGAILQTQVAASHERNRGLYAALGFAEKAVIMERQP